MSAEITFVLPRFLTTGTGLDIVPLVNLDLDTLDQVERRVAHLHHRARREGEARRFLVYDRKKEKEGSKKKGRKCPASGGISAFTFLNFLAASVSLAALLGSNTNSNNNNNNQNNNQVVTALY